MAIFNNEQYDILTAGQYQEAVENRVAKIPGMDEYPYPTGNGVEMKRYPGKLLTVQSRFNPLFRYNVADGILSDVDFGATRVDLEPTLMNLLNADNTFPGLRYSPSDFMHCEWAEAVSGYHMITLRRFAYPIDDGLLINGMPAVDVGRLVTYSTEEVNKLSEIMTMSFGFNWKELTADFWTPEVIGNESGASGLLGTLFEFANPMYLQNKGLGRNAVNVDPQYDQNKVYGPVDSITKTHIRDRGLNFNHEMNIVFEYRLRSYDGVNPKAAFIDLLSNILVVTFNDAKFWGGAYKWRGMQRGAYTHYLTVNDAFSAGKDFSSTVAYYKDSLASLAEGEHGWKAILEIGKQLLKGLEGMALDKLVTSLGRPSVAVANSLLSGEPVGTWHLTIGNPFRPILSIGNLILTNSVLSFGDQLGHDGFPTTIKLTCTLKHAKPRSRAEIESMFNGGIARTYWQPNKEMFKQQINDSFAYKAIGAKSVLAELSNEIYTYADNGKLGDWFTDKGASLTNSVNSGVQQVRRWFND